MKMFRFLGKRGFAVFTALALCVSLAAPAFAQDAYYYLKIEGDDPGITDEDNSEGNGTNKNGKWVFVGQGTAPGETLDDIDEGEFKFGELPDGYVAPEAGEEQTFTGSYHEGDSDTDEVTATIKTFHDIGKYEYYDGEGDDVPEYTYTVVWDNVTKVNGFNFGSNECGEDGIKEGEYKPGEDIRVQDSWESDTIHVNGTATLSTNPGVTVTVKMYGYEAVTVKDEQGNDVVKYVLRSAVDAEAPAVMAAEAEAEENKSVASTAVYAAAENIVSTHKNGLNLEDNFELQITKVKTEEGKDAYVGEYVEKTYTVTYTITGAQTDTRDGGTYGKQAKGDTKDKDLTSYSTSEGTYTFTKWEETVDEDGNITYTAVCTFVPFPNYDYDVPEVIEIDDPDVPLAGLFTRADAIGYLWEQSGSPEAELSDFEDVPEDHQWAVAIGWAQDNGIAVADLEGNFRPDDLVLRSVEDIELSPEGELEEFLNRYAVYAGVVLQPGERFIELAGEWDDIIMGEEAQVIFDDFFARLELALARAA